MERQSVDYEGNLIQAKKENAALRAEVERLRECMRIAGMQAFMRDRDPREVADHLRSIMDANDAENQRLRGQLTAPAGALYDELRRAEAALADEKARHDATEMRAIRAETGKDAAEAARDAAEAERDRLADKVVTLADMRSEAEEEAAVACQARDAAQAEKE